MELLEKWEEQDRKSKAGRKPLFSYRAIIILFWMHKDAKDNRYNAIARTLFAQMTPETARTSTSPGSPVTSGTGTDATGERSTGCSR